MQRCFDSLLVGIYLPVSHIHYLISCTVHTRTHHCSWVQLCCQSRLTSVVCGFPPAFQGCTAADDKTAAVEDFLRYLYGAMARDAIWQYASEDQLQDAQMAIERSVMNRIFKLAFYPNQDGDILRDQ